MRFESLHFLSRRGCFDFIIVQRLTHHMHECMCFKHPDVIARLERHLGDLGHLFELLARWVQQFRMWTAQSSVLGLHVFSLA